MTSGTINRDSFTTYPPTGGWYGVKGVKTWTGADRPTDKTKLKLETQTVMRRELADIGGMLVQYRIAKPLYSGFAQAEANRLPPKRGQQPENAYSMTDQRLTDELVNPTVPHNFGFYPVMQFMGIGSWSASTMLTANDQIKLVNKLRELTQGSDFNMSVFLGEGHQTLALLGDTAIRIAKAGWYARKGDFRGASRSLFEGTSRAPLKKRPPKWIDNTRGDLRDASSNWLQLQYGVIPLLKDAAGAAELLAHQLNTPAQRTFRTSVRKEALAFYNSQIGYQPGDRIIAANVHTHRRSLIARIKEDSTSIYATLGLWDPELVAWELMPFSFVADWFIPIGSWMEARASVGRLKGTFITSDLMTGTVYPPVSKFLPLQPRARYDSTIFTRSISTTLKVPMPEFKPLSKVASWQHCANAIALVTQVFTGGKPRGWN